jgi:hypothetical protein
MPITFDTLDELKAFHRTFKLEEQEVRETSAAAGFATAAAVAAPAPAKRKPGRPPGSTTAKKVVAAPKQAPKKAAIKAKPKATAKPVKAKAVAAPAKKIKAAEPAVKRPKGRPKSAGTLTAKIQDTIQKFLNGKQSFTANDIYTDLSKREKGVNKQSVITSVLKQMNSTFSSVTVKERPGAGPRPVKVYNAS